eukprot:CAMPEP_0119122080 /NCGR_PEP_ID=MMETSP1310-20130426/2451_1 /TAXON_ID=464262 /ORGANISM="Genus nov. species nov., Strain RCC2339" /LENGTH=314 /DNA_ID=CAMNT_0007111689 /DNA_START=66 /DNA_END=1010 /DNA_ORIENTATION=+
MTMLHAAEEGRVNVVGIMTCFGNVPNNVAIESLQRIVALFPSQRPPIFSGSERALLNNTDYKWPGHGKDGLGDAGDLFPAFEKRDDGALVQDKHAANALIDIVRDSPTNSIDVILLGPMTNLALALRLWPPLAERLGTVVFMGGCHEGKGNSADHLAAEFNIATDPEAAAIVVSTVHSLRMISWELTCQSAHSWSWFDRVIRPSPSEPIRTAVFHMTRLYEKLVRGASSEDAGSEFVMCDVLAAAVYLEPGLVEKSEKKAVFVETRGEYSRGAFVIDWYDRRSTERRIDIILKVDVPKYERLIEETLQKRPRDV